MGAIGDEWSFYNTTRRVAVRHTESLILFGSYRMMRGLPFSRFIQSYPHRCWQHDQGQHWARCSWIGDRSLSIKIQYHLQCYWAISPYTAWVVGDRRATTLASLHPSPSRTPWASCHPSMASLWTNCSSQGTWPSCLGPRSDRNARSLLLVGWHTFLPHGRPPVIGQSGVERVR